jgi:hypothetical protein
MLVVIKLLHSLIWAVMAGSIMALPFLAALRRFRWCVLVTALILLECAVLAVNGGRCPLTDLAARYTADRAPNFDIYLPLWLAEHNKIVFGLLFIVGEVVVLAFWLRDRLSQFSDPSPKNISH